MEQEEKCQYIHSDGRQCSLNADVWYRKRDGHENFYYCTKDFMRIVKLGNVADDDWMGQSFKFATSVETTQGKMLLCFRCHKYCKPEEMATRAVCQDCVKTFPQKNLKKEGTLTPRFVKPSEEAKAKEEDWD